MAGEQKLKPVVIKVIPEVGFLYIQIVPWLRDQSGLFFAIRDFVCIL